MGETVYIDVQQGDDVYAWGRNGNFKPAKVVVGSYDPNKKVISAESHRPGKGYPITLSILNADAEKLAAALLGIDTSKLYQYQEVIRDGEAEYGCTQYVEAESIEEAFELAMQYLVFNYYGNGMFEEDEVHSYKEFLVDGRDDAVELPGDYRYFIVESLRKFEISDLVSSIRSNRIDRYPIPESAA